MVQGTAGVGWTRPWVSRSCCRLGAAVLLGAAGEAGVVGCGGDGAGVEGPRAPDQTAAGVTAVSPLSANSACKSEVGTVAVLTVTATAAAVLGVTDTVVTDSLKFQFPDSGAANSCSEKLFNKF